MHINIFIISLILDYKNKFDHLLNEYLIIREFDEKRRRCDT